MSEARRLIVAHRKLRELLENKNDDDLIKILAEELGLQPFDEYAAEVVTAQFKSRVACDGLEGAFMDVRRGTGRTTKIVVRALVHVMMGSYVKFQAHNEDMVAHMEQLARQYASQLDLDMTLLDKPPDGISGANCMVFCDHHHDTHWR